MTADVEVYKPPQGRPSLPARVEYARELANSGLLPTAYRRNPSNVLWAMEYGDMLGLSPMAAITGVHVIEGKPTASAGLISALVRQAGHRLRVRGDNKSATCQIVRADDPTYTFEVTWTLRKNNDGHPSAEEAGLLNKGTWRSYPASMLKSRAITQCARDACEEALYGLHYTPEELGAEVDEEGHVVGEDASERPPANGTVRIEYGPGGTLTVDPECLAEPEAGAEPEDPWTQPWADWASEQAVTFTNKDAGRDLYRETVAQAEAGKISHEEKERILALIAGRAEDLASKGAGEPAPPPVEGTVAAPDGDPWQAEIDAMTTREDAIPLLDKLETASKGGLVDGRRTKALRAAIRTKADSLPSAPGEAA